MTTNDNDIGNGIVFNDNDGNDNDNIVSYDGIE